jgi:hypothetical protein
MNAVVSEVELDGVREFDGVARLLEDALPRFVEYIVDPESWATG